MCVLEGCQRVVVSEGCEAVCDEDGGRGRGKKVGDGKFMYPPGNATRGARTTMLRR
jgi:hypothetical protein